VVRAVVVPAVAVVTAVVAGLSVVVPCAGPRVVGVVAGLADRVPVVAGRVVGAVAGEGGGRGSDEQGGDGQGGE
jgi:hypothetical protein